MSGSKLVFDTNIFLYFFSGNKELLKVASGAMIFYSIITEIELLSFKNLTAKEERMIRDFLETCTRVNLTEEIAQETIQTRKKNKLKTSDAIILATVSKLQLPLITADKSLYKVAGKNAILFETQL